MALQGNLACMPEKHSDDITFLKRLLPTIIYRRFKEAISIQEYNIYSCEVNSGRNKRLWNHNIENAFEIYLRRYTKGADG
jgi:hypothetical protein